MDAMNGLVWPVLAAAIIGLGILAIKEPRKFNRLSPWLLAVTFLVVTVLLLWTTAYQIGVRAAFEHVKDIDELKVLEQRLKFDDNPFGISLNTFMLSFILWFFYMGVISYLPIILGPDDKPKKPTEE
jgi:amino acid transporter